MQASNSYEERRVRVQLSHGEIASLCLLLDEDIYWRKRKGQTHQPYYKARVHLRKKLYKHWGNLGNWSRGKYERGYKKTHGQRWAESQVQDMKPKYPPEVMQDIAAHLKLLRPRLEVVDAFAQKFKAAEGVVTLLENDDNALSIEFHNEWVTGVGGALWIDLILGKYRLHLNEEYTQLFMQFITHECY